ncbi:hypothetical protein [Serratia phage SP1]|nr:hypothetical protein [Serratia phage SP1]
MILDCDFNFGRKLTNEDTVQIEGRNYRFRSTQRQVDYAPHRAAFFVSHDGKHEYVVKFMNSVYEYSYRNCSDLQSTEIDRIPDINPYWDSVTGWRLK